MQLCFNNVVLLTLFLHTRLFKIMSATTFFILPTDRVKFNKDTRKIWLNLKCSTFMGYKEKRTLINSFHSGL